MAGCADGEATGEPVFYADQIEQQRAEHGAENSRDDDKDGRERGQSTQLSGDAHRDGGCD